MAEQGVELRLGTDPDAWGFAGGERDDDAVVLHIGTRAGVFFVRVPIVLDENGRPAVAGTEITGPGQAVG